MRTPAAWIRKTQFISVAVLMASTGTPVMLVCFSGKRNRERIDALPVVSFYLARFLLVRLLCGTMIYLWGRVDQRAGGQVGVAAVQDVRAVVVNHAADGDGAAGGCAH